MPTNNAMPFSYAYPEDLHQAYAFYCARYENIPYSKFLDIGINEFQMKLESIPENEPIHQIIKSRVINIGKIKDKEERKYWREMKRVNAIPDIYKSNKELDDELKNGFKNGGINEYRKLNRIQ